MRANWDQLEPRTLAPEQDQQLQQTMLGNHPEQLEQQRPQQEKAPQPQQQQQQQQEKQAASTTPGWMNDRIVVKEEPVDDKNNDSGISPGHYTSDSASPQSHHHQSPTMTSNCSLSPGSSVSHDSNALQMSGYPYSPESISPPMDFQATLDYAHAHLGQQASNQQASSPNYPVVNAEEVSSAEALGFDLPEEMEFAPESLSCPVCSFASRRRVAFSEHIKSHCSVAAGMCKSYEFNRSVLKQLLNGSNIGNLDRASPNLDDCSLDKSNVELRVPRVNPQGKVKTFRCKQCAYVAMTKVDFWMHSREHIKPEKLLTCPSCPFVTEYKHHLEYHLRNHFKSKPYKCNKCNYDCVNKSMLNSHLKSHSSVYQFSCADCSYATKYCHSLKQHLRKYEHKPGMVLNTDGSPNPLLIVEPHSTRRGPKAKPKKDDQVSQSSTVMPTVVPMQQQNSPLGAAMPQFQFNSMNGFQGFNGQAMPPTPALLGFPYTPIFPGFPMTNPFAVNTAAGNDKLSDKELEHVKARYLEFTNSLLPEAERNLSVDSYLSVNAQLAKDPAAAKHGFAQTQPDALSPPIKKEKLDTADSSSNPLDLSKTENAAHDLSLSVPSALPAVQLACAATPVNSPEASRTSRRKGRAFKIDRHFLGSNDSDEEMPQEVQRASPAERLEVRPPSSSPTSSSGDSKDSTASAFNNSTVGMSKEFTCQFCDISFGDEVMHSVHMGYHGYQNPYTCNMCGVPCADKVSFFLHIARVKH